MLAGIFTGNSMTYLVTTNGKIHPLHPQPGWHTACGNQWEPQIY